MVSFLSGSRRGRRDDSSRRVYSPLAASPETSRNRTTGQTIKNIDGEYDDGEEEVDEDHAAHKPLLHVRRGMWAAEFNMRNTNERGEESAGEDADDGHEDEDEDVDGGEDENIASPLLPRFSAAQLDRLPVYNMTHAIRLMVVQRCETTLSWDQLRSPQVSQFLVKPIQSQIRTNHFNRATLCALVANSLQFHKEGQLNAANVGVLRTRALISELLAMRLIKEFTTRDLIDALSYDFDPLQGMTPPPTSARPNNQATRWTSPQEHSGFASQVRGARVSTVEIAIRAQAKRFLAHPVVVQHLEAIWAGTIVFHSEADSLHRRRPTSREASRQVGVTSYGAICEHSPRALPADTLLAHKGNETRTNQRPSSPIPIVRRSVTLYDPRDASLFKLSRLRVPRYRQVVSTLSFATLLALFLAVLVERSADITPLEVVFWFWSIGYMLDEIVGFTEQGFGLYILSFWNAFDLGILLMFAIYFVLRIYGIVLADQTKHRIVNNAYDVLGSTAILLFPRLFSVLDHYRYFSQLLIAFRLMAQDLMAIMVLIVISCSGFFVAFTLSFAEEPEDARSVAYALFQIVMGFTPAAWDRWDQYNVLGQAILMMFLIICHFVVVTVLITVLTNSFMAIVRNAEEEHQFLFAVNTISMVKSDALFSYVAPANIIGWALSPLRYVLPFRQYLKFNRTVIKVTHFPLLFIICGYERVILSKYTYEPTDLIASATQSQRGPVAMAVNKERDVFATTRRLREPSIIGSQKDRALDEVFRRPYRGNTVRTTVHDMTPDAGNATNAVTNWMQLAENEGGASPPLEQPRSVVERLEHRRPFFRRATTMDKLLRGSRSREFSATRSLASEPDVLSTLASRRPYRILEEPEQIVRSRSAAPQETDADGDDENNGDSEAMGPLAGESMSLMEKTNTPRNDSDENDEYFPQIPVARMPVSHLSAGRLPASTSSPHAGRSPAPRMRHHRNASSGTALFAPPQLPTNNQLDASAAMQGDIRRPPRLPNIRAQTDLPFASAATNPAPIPIIPPSTSNLHPDPQTRAPKPPKAPRSQRPSVPARLKTAPSPMKPSLTFLETAHQSRRDPSFNARALDLASDLGDNKFGPSADATAAFMPASFSEQLFREREIAQHLERERRKTEDAEESGMVNRIVLARMNRLEEGFREVLKEIKEMSSLAAGSSRRESDAEGLALVSGSWEGERRTKGRSGLWASRAPTDEAASTPGGIVGSLGSAGAEKGVGSKRVAGIGAVARARKSSKKNVLPTAAASPSPWGSATPPTPAAELVTGEGEGREGTSAAGGDSLFRAVTVMKSSSKLDEEDNGNGKGV